METQEPIIKPLESLSASKIKTLENCSWLYWCNYHLRLPQIKNEGSMKGSACHYVFELLILDKYKPLVDLVVRYNSITVNKALERLTKKYIKREGLPTKASIFEQIDQMILVGLKNDFYVKGGTLVSPEFKFDIIDDDFRIKGLMDKPFIRGDTIIIDDYKSSKQKFKGEDEESNIQAMMYSYAATRIWPHLKPLVRFIFLQYPDNPIMEVSFTKDTLKGFEKFLKGIQKRVTTFNEKSAKSYFAADQATHDEGFAKRPDELKKDGTPKWYCSYKFPYDYFEVKKDNKIVYTVMEKSQIKTLKLGEYVIKKHYDGCPRWRNAVDSIEKPKMAKSYANALDDF